MSILASRGMSVPTFQPAGSKGDGGGNGGGGMYFGGGQQQEEYNPFGYDDFNYFDEDEKHDAPYHAPIPTVQPDMMKILKTALARTLYAKIVATDFLAEAAAHN